LAEDAAGLGKRNDATDARGIGRAGRWRLKVSERHGVRSQDLQTRVEQEVVSIGCMVQSVDGQDVAGSQQRSIGGQVELAIIQRDGLALVHGCRGIPVEGLGSVRAGYFNSVQVGHETVVVPHLQFQFGDRFGSWQVKR